MKTFLYSAMFPVLAALACATPEQDAAARVQAAFVCDYITETGYEIPQTDDAVQADAALLYRYVKKHRSLPKGVAANSDLGRLLQSALLANQSERNFLARVQEELLHAREIKLDELHENASFFADAQVELTLYGDEDSVVITFDCSGENPPEVDIDRSNPVNRNAYTVNLSFSGRIALDGDTWATLLLDPAYSLVVVNRPEDCFSAELARHFGCHCKYVTYFGELENDTPRMMELSYTPEGEQTSPPIRSIRAIPVYFCLQNIGE
ncbi:MAG: hypothetical protein IJB33_00865 [Akkermansia sp.]|nr:hypothetical protein [Akkermansia sp.]